MTNIAETHFADQLFNFHSPVHFRVPPPDELRIDLKVRRAIVRLRGYLRK